MMIVPLSVIPIIVIGRKVRGLSRLSQDKIANINSRIEESLNGIKTVQAYNREEYENQLFSQTVALALEAAIKRTRIRSLLIALVVLLVFLAMIYVLWVGGNYVITGKMTPGELSSFLFYSVLVASSFGGLSEVIGDLQRAAGATERLFELLEIKSDIQEPTTPKHINNNFQQIIFDHVSFAYPSRPNMDALIDINFSINRGEIVAIVGPSGSGKSTIMQLLLRFYDYQTGMIRFDDVGINELPLAELRNLFATVPQDPLIFSGTAYDNILYGRLDATAEEVKQAARSAEILDFIETLPQGFNTFLGEKGIRLSGGQRQRIAIARAILKNPQILLLDEATSSLDSENEKLVQEALDNLMLGRTTIVIAHRISTIYNSHKIIVLNQGRIEAIGSHLELIQHNELYQRLNQNV
jgi:ATP-binding cassette subfamily B protein